ncbi:hypothetical protein [Acanthopleuribacter pedis]|uniref:Uncharacterized protein n=1 Tax=Acanthopleuribacter pedis TaxID=442870 RepID=A0A8J7U4R8_9BACT|nr:hypothetical protein [Acanthopleuribacter pedis]MBO1319738.1 hypothetical protein [Acanthopleuribacter pedis]
MSNRYKHLVLDGDDNDDSNDHENDGLGAASENDSDDAREKVSHDEDHPLDAFDDDQDDSGFASEVPDEPLKSRHDQNVVEVKKPDGNRNSETVQHKDTGAEEDNYIHVSAEQIINHHKDGFKIIAVIGYADSGKTFFIHRMRHAFNQRSEWQAEPGALYNKAIPFSSLEEVTETRVTTKDRSRKYIILDISGENFRRAFGSLGRDESFSIDSQSKSTKINLSSVYLSLLGLADAYMLFMPALRIFSINDSELSDEGRKEFQNSIRSFRSIIGLIKVAQSRVFISKEKPLDFIQKGINLLELERAFLNPDVTRCSRPIMVAYSKADVYRGYIGDAKFDVDPFYLAFSSPLLKPLSYALYHFFDHFRFDFLSAFEGLEKDQSTPNYDLPCPGAIEVFSWIEGVLRSQQQSENYLKQWIHGRLKTRRVLDIRRHLDPRFRSIWQS